VPPMHALTQPSPQPCYCYFYFAVEKADQEMRNLDNVTKKLNPSTPEKSGLQCSLGNEVGVCQRWLKA